MKRFSLLVVFILLSCSFCFSQLKALFGCTAGVSGPHSPASTETVAIAGSTSTWSNKGNITASDDSYSTNTTDLAANGSYTDYLIARNFGISMTSDCAPGVITFSVERSNPNTNIDDYRVRWVINGAIQTGCDYANNTNWPAADAIRTYALDAGQTCVGRADVMSAFFGLAFSANRDAAAGVAATAQVDHITVSSTYGLPPACGEFCVINYGLPVELTSFELFSKRKNEVDLYWTTATEINNEYFVVERSLDAKTFVEVGRIKGSGNSNTIVNYYFTDKELYAGRFYYRLKQVDFDGKFKYSDVRSVRVKTDDDIYIYHNMDLNYAIVNFIELPQTMPDIFVANAMGQKISVPKNMENFLDGKIKLDLRKLTSGVYFVSVDDAGIKQSKKIIIP